MHRWKPSNTAPGLLPKALTLLLPALVLLAVMLWGLAAQATAQVERFPPRPGYEPNTGLFLEPEIAGECLTNTYILRTRPVDIDFDVLGGLEGPDLAGELTGDVVGLNLFASGGITVELTAVLKELLADESGFTWIGFVDEDPEESEVYLEIELLETTAGYGQLVGTIDTYDNTYEIYPSPDGYSHCVAEVDYEALMFNEDDARFPPPSTLAASPATPYAGTATADDGSLIDVLVLYTPQARDEAGGTAAIKAVAQTFVDRANRANVNSAVATRLSLVDAAEVAYSRLAVSATDLDRLTNAGDGFLEEAQTLRNSSHADMVLLIVRDAGTYDTGGLAWIAAGTTAQTSSEGNAYGLGTLGCARSLCFVHEAGHIQGLNHDWFVSARQNPYPYGHGYTDLTANFVTVMSYFKRCNQAGVSCSWISNFSNPNIRVKGQPTGVADSAPTNCVINTVPPAPCAANASQVLNNTAPFVAQFRSSWNLWTGNADTNWENPANWTMNEGPATAPIAVQRAPRPFDDVLIPATPPGGRFPVIGANASLRNLTIENGASLFMGGGTLAVFGQWEERGTGRFVAAGGTVIFKGRLPQSVQMNASSNLPNLQIGDGGAQQVQMLSDLDINGNLTIKAGATLDGGAGGHTLRVSGQWSDEGTSFVAGNSHVIFDGTTQAVDKVTMSVLLGENFDQFTQCCGSGLPTGWSGEPANVFFQGPLGGNLPSPTANLWSNSSDGWLISSPLVLRPGVTYQLEYKVAVNQQGGSAPGGEQVTVALGQAANSGALTEQLDTATIANEILTTRTAVFTVAAGGTYYIGFRGQNPNGNIIAFDDLTVRGVQGLLFHDLTVAAGTTTFNQDVTVNSTLTVEPGATASFGSQTAIVEGAVVNNGILRQVKDVTAAATTRFLHIQNGAKSATTYLGVDLTAAGGFGSTTVEVRGNQTGCTANVTDPLMRRCFTITPTTPGTATVKFWFTEADRNAQAANTASVFQIGAGLTPIGSNTTRSEAAAACQSGGGAGCSVQADGIGDYSQAFGLGSNSTGQAHALTVTRGGTGTGTVTSAPAGIDCGATCSGNFNSGTVVVLAAVPDAGSAFTGWSGSGCSGTGMCSVTLDAAKDVTATFDPAGTAQPQSLTVAKAGTGAGRVTSAPAGIDCGATCNASFNAGVVVVLTAQADAGSTFAGWAGSGCAGTNSCTLTMDAAKSVTATFSPSGGAQEQMLTVTKAGNGSGTVTSAPAGIDCGATCSASFGLNSVVVLSPLVTTGSTFSGWSGSGCGGTSTCTVKMSGAKSVVATFSQTAGSGNPAKRIYLSWIAGN